MEIGGEKRSHSLKNLVEASCLQGNQISGTIIIAYRLSFFPDMNLQLSRNLPTRPISKEKLYSPPRATLAALSLNLPVECHIQDTCGATLSSHLSKMGRKRGKGFSEALWDVSAAQILKLE